MSLKINDKSKICFSHIDLQISNYIKQGKEIDFIKNELQAKVLKFEILLKELDKDLPRYHFIKTHNDVCMKRILDFCLIERLSESVYKNESLSQLFNMIKLRDKFLRLS